VAAAAAAAAVVVAVAVVAIATVASNRVILLVIAPSQMHAVDKPVVQVNKAAMAMIDWIGNDFFFLSFTIYVCMYACELYRFYRQTRP